ncbi:hypothetical protein WDW86_16015 [Bdellovibrionota bacterium FG-2]
MGQMVDELKADLAAADPTALAAKIGKMEVTRSSADCFGPAWVDNTANGGGGGRPVGDLGIVYDTASNTDSTPCAAAQLNALMSGTPQFANKLVKMQATLITALGAAGQALPAVGASIDGLSVMPAVTGVTFTVATLERLADVTADSTAVYKTTFAYTNTSGGSSAVTIIHNPKNANNTDFVGYLKATIPEGTTSGGNGPPPARVASSVAYRGISLIYQQTGDVLTFALDSAQNRETSSADFFSTTSGRIDYSKDAYGSDANKIIATFNQTTGASTMHYAWQAGRADLATRTFAVSVNAAGAGTAYFGFGADIASITDTTSSLWADKMFCDWLGAIGLKTPGATSFPVSSYVTKLQKQTFSKDAAGLFTIAGADSLIDFAPVVSCNGTFTVTASTSPGSTTPSYLLGAHTVTTNELVAIPAAETIPAVTVPTLPFTL